MEISQSYHTVHNLEVRKSRYTRYHNVYATVSGEVVTGSISWLSPNWVHIQVREIDNIVVKTPNLARNLKF